MLFEIYVTETVTYRGVVDAPDEATAHAVATEAICHKDFPCMGATEREVETLSEGLPDGTTIDASAEDYADALTA